MTRTRTHDAPSFPARIPACAAQPSAQRSSIAHPLTALQRGAGNQAVQRILQAKAPRPEADFVSRAADMGSIQEVLHSPGQPLESATLGFMESRFGRDFSQVRVHTGAQADKSARAVNAQAYTIEGHIAFADGQYAPRTAQGSRLLAHELAHVVQQNGGAGTASRASRAAPLLQRQAGGKNPAGKTYPFSVKTSGCDVAPFSKVTVEVAAKTAFEKVRDSDCVKTASLREDILAEFGNLGIECKQPAKGNTACAESTRPISLYPNGLNCGGLEGTLLHEVVHYLEWAWFSSEHGDLSYACEESCFPGASLGRGKPSRCTFETGWQLTGGVSGGVGFSSRGTPTSIAHFYVGFERRVVGVVHPSLGLGYALIGESTGGRPGIGSEQTALLSVIGGLRLDPGLPGGGYLSFSGGGGLAYGNKTLRPGVEVGVALGFRWRVLDISLDAGVTYDPTREAGLETNYTLGATIRFGRSVPRR